MLGQLNIAPGEWLIVFVFYLLPIAVLWFIVKTAVLSALRQHDRERSGQGPRPTER